mmetsp:Transcript_26324/g.47445  ORF Transcript_26324/g.47445 Transcript_26324/m.47445 type:complete len:254 (+) Transcript_26324:642-1403(+)
MAYQTRVHDRLHALPQSNHLPRRSGDRPIHRLVIQRQHELQGGAQILNAHQRLVPPGRRMGIILPHVRNQRHGEHALVRPRRIPSVGQPRTELEHVVIGHHKRHRETELGILIPVQYRGDGILRGGQDAHHADDVHYGPEAQRGGIVGRAAPSLNAGGDHSVLRDGPQAPQGAGHVAHHVMLRRVPPLPSSPRGGLEEEWNELAHQLPLHGHARPGICRGDGAGVPPAGLVGAPCHRELESHQGAQYDFGTAQ